jgi:hypothetical protein
MSGATYHRWPLGNDVSLFLNLADGAGSGVTGAAPLVSIQRYRELNGALLDGYYWNSASFVDTITFLSMSEVDSTNYPGLYVYHFSQSMVQQEHVYNVYYKNTVSPVGFDQEVHYFVTATSGSGDVKLYESEPS